MNKAAATRRQILEKAFGLIYEQGYQNTSLDEILATTHVTKGAFYYHFRNKDEMGLAIIEEVLKPALQQGFIAPLAADQHPLDTIYRMMHDLLLKNEFMNVAHGCPAANLTQEMTPWHEDFTGALNELTHQWNGAMNSLIEAGKKRGLVRKDVNAKQVTLFVMSGYWGVRNFARLENSSAVYRTFLKELKRYLDTLK